jgi:hypothetical protein
MDAMQEEKMLQKKVLIEVSHMEKSQIECKKIYEKAWEKLLRFTSNFSHELKL